jgi:hypothetical protein
MIELFLEHTNLTDQYLCWEFNSPLLPAPNLIGIQFGNEPCGRTDRQKLCLYYALIFFSLDVKSACNDKLNCLQEDFLVHRINEKKLHTDE